ncbi:hypothetical protein SAMD00019534_024520, partial [Acytostelium subglobosum LB1]|uniref:hypothetical protein n=1 Tax=Acytostelium subglobosum LB1 TaxID=1410327 RepID=UPI000644A1EF
MSLVVNAQLNTIFYSSFTCQTLINTHIHSFNHTFNHMQTYITHTHTHTREDQSIITTTQ